MPLKRKLKKTYTPPSQSGFLGGGHVARPIIQVDFTESDPFILLMDDMLEKEDDRPVGGPHPHAGFETVSLLLEGKMGEEPHVMREGDFEIMTAGSGIIHTETIAEPTKMRLLQLWLNLPKNERHASPRLQRLQSEQVPQTSLDGVTIKVYSGSLAGVTSPIYNYTPVTIGEIRMNPRASTVLEIPAQFNTFLYLIEGSILVGEEEKILSKDQVGWLDLYKREEETSELLLKAGESGAHFVLYSAAPQNHNIVAHGPFIADSMDEIRQLYSDFKEGKLAHISEVE
jgi:redox-sensitive bicupin YhaK (pirin superfamily)